MISTTFILSIFVSSLIDVNAGVVEVFGLPPIRSTSPKFFKQNRIYGGQEVNPHSIPYQVALYIYSSSSTSASFCGGSLISNKFILTAAHCLWKKTRAEIVLGGHNLNNPDENEVRIESTDFILHEEFTYTVSNDIALIRIKRIMFTDAIQPVTLPSYKDKSKNFVGTSASISGWGRTEGSSSISNVLLKTEEEVITNDLCVYYFGDKVKHIHICTDGVNYRGPCNGDSGGPMIIDAEQVGIVSFGSSIGCMNFGFPNGYTRLTEFLEWIEEHSDVKIRE